MQKIFEKIGCHGDMSIPGPFNGYHKMRHNSAVTRQINWNFGTKRQNRFSHGSLEILVLGLIFLVPDPIIVKSLKEAWDRQSLTDKQTF